jgi:phosphatidylserine/phosphatidylglycerophosphate/cardiolipin synthase-like enzyme
MRIRVCTLCVLAALAVSCDKPKNGKGIPVGDSSEEGIAVYFEPKKCRDAIVDAIKKAKNRIQVQAYSFESDNIADALVSAHKRGVKVKVIIDAEKADKKSELGKLHKRGVETLIDNEHEKAHNKIIIIDGETLITGSFNFNDPTVESAENLLVIRNKPKLIRAYEDNFERHAKHSEEYKP